MNSLITTLMRLWTQGTATPAARQQSMLLLMGVIGWIVIVLAYPFDWELPEYATY